MAMKVIMARDPLFEDVKKFVQQQKVASCSMIQRRFMLGFNRAGQILEQLEQQVSHLWNSQEDGAVHMMQEKGVRKFHTIKSHKDE